LWVLFLGILFFAIIPSISWHLATGSTLFMILLMGGSNWLGSKRIIESLKNHSLEIKGNALIFTDRAVRSEVDLNSIHSIVIDKNKKNVVAISISRIKGQKEELPPYEDLNGLAENLIKVLPNEMVKVRGWFHL